MCLVVDIIENLNSYLNVFRALKLQGWISAIVEILIIAFVIYHLLMWIKNTRSWILLRGAIVIGVLALVAYYFSFSVILFIIKNLSMVVVVAIIIVFQEDLRQGLEHLGRQKVFSKLIPDLNKYTKKTSEDAIQEICAAAFAMSEVKTGALIVIERAISLEEIERTGISINGKVTRQLFINIFEKNTPLHDGAVLVVGDIIKAATCYLPLSHNYRISKDLGTRHRAALGVSEISDSITVVVSEETGRVSVCDHSEIKVMSDEEELMKTLTEAIVESSTKNSQKNESKNLMKGWLKQ